MAWFIHDLDHYNAIGMYYDMFTKEEVKKQFDLFLPRIKERYILTQTNPQPAAGLSRRIINFLFIYF